MYVMYVCMDVCMYVEVDIMGCTCSCSKKGRIEGRMGAVREVRE